MTHPLVDAMTDYGTQLASRFTNYPFGAGRRPDLQRALPWLWQRTWGTPLPPPG